MSTNLSTTTRQEAMAGADILVVDDTIASLRLLTEILTGAGYRVRPAERPQMALDSALAHPPSLILLDVKMPEMSGFELCQRLKSDVRTREIPVIFVSALQEVDDRVQGFEVGGVDFVSKPFQASEVVARVQTHLQLRMMQHHLEEMVAARTTELRAVNRALAASEEKFRTLVTNTEEIVYMIAKDGEFLLSEGKGLAKLGLKPGEVVGKSVFELYKDYPKILDAIRRAFSGETITVDQKLDDEYLRSWYTPHVDAAGQIVGLMGLSINITERKLAELGMQAYQQRLKALAAQLTLAEEHERRRIAADLHDDIGQTLSFARIQLATARKATSEERRNALLDDTSQTLLKTIQTTRSLVFDLSSPLLDDIDLEAALAKWMEAKISGQHGLNTEIFDDGQEKPLSKDMQLVLFRNVRELLTNVLKHAHASHVIVRMTRVGGTLKVSVKDDGNGMDIGAMAKKSHRNEGFGLLSIEERMGDLGGSLEIVSSPGEGCTAILTAPLAIGPN